MPKNDKKRNGYPAVARFSAAAIAVVMAIGTAAAQDSPLAASPSALGIPAIPSWRFGGGLAFSTAGSTRWHESDAAGQNAVHFETVQRVTLEQVKQQRFVAPTDGPMAHLGQLSVEAAKQHRLGAESDYLPKISATVTNLHFSEFLGQVATFNRPLTGAAVAVPLPLLSQNQTIVAVTFVQPISPIFQVYQLVKIARADERIAKAKAGMPIAKNGSGVNPARYASDAEVEDTYFRLLIAQNQLTSAEMRLRGVETKSLYVSASDTSLHAPDPEPELVEVNKTRAAARIEAQRLTTSLNRMMGWADDTQLELVRPDPLIEDISFKDVADAPATANPDLVEAEQTAVKAHAAAVLSKLAYMPTVAATAGFIYQNAIPLLPSTFGYGGLMMSYNLFDFGKREHAVKEANAQLGMAEIGVELTKAKIAASLKKAYYELERSRQVSQTVQQMGSSVTRLMNVASAPESVDMKAARAKVETEMLEADFAHRQAYAHLRSLMDGRKLDGSTETGGSDPKDGSERR